MGASLNSCCSANDVIVDRLDVTTQLHFEGVDAKLRSLDYPMHPIALGELDESSAAPRRLSSWTCARKPNLCSERLVQLVAELFSLQDLDSDGLLEEVELVKLNENIAVLHHGKDIDRAAVKEKYRMLFRENLDAEGRPVPVATFSRYVFSVLRELDPDPMAQEMILEQFIAEARSARELFHCKSFWSSTDAGVEVNTPRRPGFPLSLGEDPRAVHYRDESNRKGSSALASRSSRL